MRLIRNLLVVTALLAMQLHATNPSIVDFTIDGIQYNISSVTKKTVTVVGVVDNMTGDYVIPQEVEFSGVTFTVVEIGWQAFDSYLVQSVTIPPSVTYIVDCAFYQTWDSNLEKLVIEDSPTILNCTWLHGINNIETGQFSKTAIKQLYLGRDLDFPPFTQYRRFYKPFQGVNTIETLEIGEYVTDASHLDLSQCQNLKSIRLYGSTPPSAPDVTNVQLITIPVIVPKGSLETYKATYWGMFYNLKEVENSTSKLTFEYDNKLGSVYVNRQFVESEISLENGSDAQITIIPFQGIEIRSVLVNGQECLAELTNNTLYLQNVNGDLTIQIVLSAPQRMVRLVVEGGTYGIAVENGSSLDLLIEPDDGWSLMSVFVNGKDCTALLVDNRLPLDSVTENLLVQTVFEGDIDAVSPPKSRDVDVAIEGKNIIVHNAGNDSMRIYNTQGHLLYDGQSGTFTVPQMGIYIVKIGQNTYKLAL